MILEVTSVVTLSISVIITFMIAWGVFGNAPLKTVSDEQKSVFSLPYVAYVFWSIIYGAQYVHLIRATLIPATQFTKIGGWNIAISILNVLWVYLFCKRMIWVSSGAMVAILSILLKIYFMIDIKYFRGDDIYTILFDYAPYSIYLGWIIVACFANLFAIGKQTLDDREIESVRLVESQQAAAVVLFLGIVSGFLFVIQRNDFIIAVVTFVVTMLLTWNNKKDMNIWVGFVFSTIVIASCTLADVIIILY